MVGGNYNRVGQGVVEVVTSGWWQSRPLRPHHVGMTVDLGAPIMRKASRRPWLPSLVLFEDAFNNGPEIFNADIVDTNIPVEHNGGGMRHADAFTPLFSLL